MRGGALCLEAPTPSPAQTRSPFCQVPSERITATQNVPLTVSLSTNAVLTLATTDALHG